MSLIKRPRSFSSSTHLLFRHGQFFYRLSEKTFKQFLQATSGITANTNCKDAYDRLKTGWKDPSKPSEVKRYKYIVYALNKTLTEIIVETTSEDGTWSDFLAALPENEPRWGIFDLEYEKDGLKKKILFINWYVVYSS
jgi:Cofilin/tropomyosin-type actin-binding protein